MTTDFLKRLEEKQQVQSSDAQLFEAICSLENAPNMHLGSNKQPMVM